jgi:hypothetical protein
MGGQYRRTKEFAEDPSNKLHLYPNPVQNILQISSEVLTENDQASIELFDIMGKLVLKEQLSYSEGSWKLDVKQLTAGVYYVRFTLNNSHILTNKLVKY